MLCAGLLCHYTEILIIKENALKLDLVSECVKGAAGAPSDKDFKDAAKTAKDFTPCKGCPTRGACKKSGKCLMKTMAG